MDDVSLGSPAATVVTVASSQATYNTHALLVPNSNEAPSAPQDPKIRKEERGPQKSAAQHHPVQSRLSIPTPASGAALENLESTDMLEQPLKNIRAMNVNEDHRLDQEPQPTAEVLNQRPDAQQVGATAPRAARISLASHPSQPAPALQKLRVQGGQKIHLAGFPGKNKISIIKKHPAQKAILNQLQQDQQPALQQKLLSQHHSNQDMSKGSFVSGSEHSYLTSAAAPQKKITLIKQNHIKRVQLPGSNASYNDAQMERAGMTQLSAVSGVSGASAVSGLSGAIAIDVPMQRLKIKKSPIQTANFGAMSNYAPQSDEAEATQPSQKQLPTHQVKPKRL